MASYSQASSTTEVHHRCQKAAINSLIAIPISFKPGSRPALQTTNMKKLFILLPFLSLAVFSSAQTDDELAALLNETEVAENTFYSTRIINSHSVEMVPKGVMEFRISHRFGQINNGFYDLFGLDAATMRMSFDYGITDKLTVALGRSTNQKTYDAFTKYEILHQQSGGDKNIPFSLVWVSGMSARTLEWADERYENYSSNRFAYFHQVLLAKQFSKETSVQLMPTFVHRNLVETKAEKNDVISLGGALHQQITPSMVLNMEYFYNLPNQTAEDMTNSLSMGLVFNTGWHSFSIHVSNSPSMYERGFITETSNRWDKGQIHFGFNITREFHLVEDW